MTATITDKDVQVLLETAFSDTMGLVDVVHQGDCANFAYTVVFKTNKGDQPAMTVSSHDELTKDLQYPSFPPN